MMNQQRNRQTNMNRMVENLNEQRNADRQRQQQQTDRPAVRVQLQPAFSVDPIAPNSVELSLQSELSRAVERLGTPNARIEVSGRSVILQGSVSDRHQRALVERMVSMEPGVSQIENQLTIEGEATESQP